MSDQTGELDATREGEDAREDPAAASRVHTREAQEGFARLWADDATIYLSGYLANLSEGGMFVRLVDPPPVGTRLLFELELEGGRERREGVGEVVWSRWKYGGPRRPPGIGVRFLRIEATGEGASKATEAPAGPMAEAAPFEPLPDGPLLPEPVLPDLPPEEPSRQEPTRPGAITEPELMSPLPEQLSALPEERSLPRVDAPRAARPVELPDRPLPAVEDDLPWEEDVVVLGRPSRRRWPLLVAILGAALGGAGWWMLRSPKAAESPAVVTEIPEESRLVDEPRVATAVEESAATDGGEPGMETVGDLPTALPTLVEAPPPDPLATPWPPVSGVEEVGWRVEPGRTTIRVTANGEIDAERVRISRIGLPNPRAVIELDGVREPYRPTVLEIASPEVARIRFGHHPPATLRLVFDLESADLEVRRSAIAPNQVDFAVSRR